MERSSLFFCLLVILIFACPLLSRGQDFLYTDREGEEVQKLQVSKRYQENALEFTLHTEGKSSRHFYKPLGFTQRWELKDQKEQHNFIAEREGNRIKIEGTYAGKPVEKVVEVNALPWINKLDHGLSEWVRSDENELEFWALKLNSGLDPIRFEAEKVGVETIHTPAGTFQAIKVKLNLHGLLLSSFWSAYSWYRQDNGLFLKYEGDNGPGTPLRTIELVKIH